VVLAEFGQLGADLCVWCSRCGVRAPVLAWSCSSGQSPNPRRLAARPAFGRNSNHMSNTVLGMMDSTSFLTIRGKRQGAQPSTGIGRAVFEGARGNTPQHPHTLHAAVEGAHSEGSWLRTFTRRSVRRWPREIHASQELIGCPEKQACNQITRGGPVI